ncbi:MAG: methyltransferase, partial [Bacteroidetes bacterium HGW-Bacteroidetes-22]
GNGAALRYFNRKGWRGKGVEPASEARRHAISSGLEVFEENFLDEASGASFDLITMWHVLEHVYDVPERLKQIRRLVKSDGLVVVALPNPGSYDALHYGAYWAAWDVPRHLYHFSQKSVELLAMKAGFEVTAIRPMWFDAFYVALTSEKYKKSGYFGIISALLIGFWSNFVSGRGKQGTSSLIYYLRPR